MLRTFFTYAFVLCLLAPSSTTFADDFKATGPHIEVRLLSESETLVPGATQYLAIHMLPEEEWHTYWRNPGDSGEAPSINWQSTHSLSFGDVQWPLPEAIPVAHLVNYGYNGQHLLMVPVSVPPSATMGENVLITADLSWLVCKEDCIPGWATLNLELPVGESLKLSSSAHLFSQTRDTLPENEWLDGQIEINQDSIALRFAVEQTNTNQNWYAFPFRADIAQHAGVQSQVIDNGFVNLLIAKSDYFPKDLENARFLVTNGERGYYINAAQVALGEDSSVMDDSLSFVDVLLFAGMAFLGGLILNIMPCVLPILSIKALALQHTNKSVAHNSAYLLGVLACFNAFALLIIGLQSTGEQLGWGFHMQSPVIIVMLAFLFTFIALVLLDVFSVGSRMAGVGEGLVTGDTPKSHFFTGLLAVIVASPCTAPFMAAALGIAMVSSPLTTLIIFNALALGFALPLTLLFLSSRLRNYLPKPGQWMQTFKHFLAFPMFATVAWLCWVYAGQQGALAQFVLLLSLIGFSLFAWLLGSAKGALSGLWVILMVGTFLSPVLLSPVPQNAAETASTKNDLPYDPSVLNQLKQSQQVVLVNMTADWCITCKVNEHVALQTDVVQEALAEQDVNYMVGDWTNKNDEILNYLKQYERAGVPLYVVYAGDKSATVLPQILTPGLVVEALNKAKQELTYVN